MTEANFAGTGAAAGVWLSTSLKDNLSKAIRQSIVSSFEHNMFGMTMVRSDLKTNLLSEHKVESVSITIKGKSEFNFELILF